MMQYLRVGLAGGLVAESRREDDLGVFARLEWQLMYIHRQHVKEVVAQDGREELENELGVHFCVCVAVSLVRRDRHSCATRGCGYAKPGETVPGVP